MQNESSKPDLYKQLLRNSHNPTAKFGHSSPLEAIRKSIAESVKAEPKTRTIQLAETLIRTVERNALYDLTEILVWDFYVRAIRAERRNATAEQFRLPGFEHLPLNITGPKGAPIPLIEASFTRVRAYYRTLMKSHNARRRNDPKIKEAKKLMDEMRKRSKRNKAITVREAILLDL